MVHIIDDMIVEMNESFSIKLLSSDIVHVSPSKDTTTVTILDDLSDGESATAHKKKSTYSVFKSLLLVCRLNVF